MKKSDIFKPDVIGVNNNEKVYYSYLDDKLDIKSNNPSEFISRLDKNGSYMFSKRVVIKTRENIYDTKIAGKVKDKIITIDSKVIPISEIVDIYEK